MKNTQNITRLASAIAATVFLSLTAILPQAAFAQNPGASGDPRVDEPNTNTRVDDPSRPATNMDRPANSAPTQGGIYSNPNGQMNNSGMGGGAGGSEAGRSMDQTRPEAPQNRIERYSQPGATDPSRSTEFNPPANAPSNSSGQMNQPMNNTGTGSGSGGMSGDRGNDRFTAPSSNMPGRGTYTAPRGQVNDAGVGGGAGGTVDNQINNSTSPGSATPGSGSTNYNNNVRPNNTNVRPINNGSGVNNSGGSTTGGGAGGSGAVPGLW